MRNLSPDKQHARIVIDTYHEEARRLDLRKLARAGHPRHVPGGTLLPVAVSARERLLAGIRHERMPTCEPCLTC